MASHVIARSKKLRLKKFERKGSTTRKALPLVVTSGWTLNARLVNKELVRCHLQLGAGIRTLNVVCRYRTACKRLVVLDQPL